MGGYPYLRATSTLAGMCRPSLHTAPDSSQVLAPVETHFEHDAERIVENLLVFVLLSVLLHVDSYRHVELDLPGLVLDGGQEPCLLRDKLPRVLRCSEANKKQQERKYWENL